MTKDKVIKMLKREYNENVWWRYRCLNKCPDNVDYLNDLLIALLTAIDVLEQSIESEPVNDWINVKNRLPENDGKYMVWYKGELDICEFDAESQTFGNTYDDYDEIYSHLVCWDDDMNKDVTHWQPMPEPPKEESDVNELE